MRPLAIVLAAAVLTPALMACAPAQTPSQVQPSPVQPAATQPAQAQPAQPNSTKSGPQPTKPAARALPNVSLDVFPIKKGESWVVSASSGDDSESREFAMELDEGPELEASDDGAPVLFASASAGETFADLVFYPDDAFLFVQIPLEVKRDANKAKSVFCFFDKIEAGKARSKGQSFFGTTAQLDAAKERSQFGECLLSKKR
jgi:hypothetical protein